MAARRNWRNGGLQATAQRGFSGTGNLGVVKPYLLADIGEGTWLTCLGGKVYKLIAGVQVSPNARLSSGLYSRGRVSSNSIRSVKYSRIRRLLRYVRSWRLAGRGEGLMRG